MRAARTLPSTYPDRAASLCHSLEWTAGTVRVRTAKSVTPTVPGLGVSSVRRLDVHDARPSSSVPARGELLAGDPDLDGFDCGAEVERKARRIEGWSQRSRVRMLYRLASVDWTSVPGIPEMVTLTYPGDWRAVAPDGRAVKRHLRAFQLRWVRRWGVPCRGAWKLEFQRRGAPHVHIYCFRPVGSSLVEFRRWLSQAWFEVVGSGDARHLAAGTGLDRQFCAASRSAKAIAWYFFKHNGKNRDHYQHCVPSDFEDVGRFWGLWAVEPVHHEVQLTTAEFVQVRRLLVSFRRALLREARETARRRQIPYTGRSSIRAASQLTGTWALSVDPQRFVLQALDLIREGAPALAGAPPRTAVPV